MSAKECWLTAGWSFVRAQLPPPPVAVLEIGCGPRGGFVPALLEDGYEAVGVDPEAPEGSGYHRVEFERFDVPHPVPVVVASTSLHHVADLDQVLDRMATALVPGGRVVVIEFAWERFDEATAEWCFARLPAVDAASGVDAVPAAEAAATVHAADAAGHAHGSADGEASWLHRHRDGWIASGQGWTTYRRAWAQDEGLHRGDVIMGSLDERLERRHCAEGPYFFCDLVDTTAADEQVAIDTGEIQPVGLRYVGQRR